MANKLNLSFFDRECASCGPKKAKKMFLLFLLSLLFLQTFDQSVENVTLMKNIKKNTMKYCKAGKNIKQLMQFHSRSCTEKDFQSSLGLKRGAGNENQFEKNRYFSNFSKKERETLAPDLHSGVLVNYTNT